MPNAVVQVRQRLRADVFLWFEKTPLSHWNGLTLMVIDGTLWRAPDIPENDAVFGRTANKYARFDWPELRLVCQMEVATCCQVSSLAVCVKSVAGI